MKSLDWLATGQQRNWPELLAAVFTTAVVLVIVLAVATSTTAFGPYNYTWDGTSEFRDRITDDPETDLEIVHDTGQYEAVNTSETVAFVIAPETGYSDTDVERIRQYVEDGGTLVVLENFGPHSNELLAAVGADARTDGRLLRDDINYEYAPTMPVATVVGDDLLAPGIDEVMLNYATAIEPGDATVVARTSDFAYAVETAEENLSADDELESKPVATIEAVGAGEVVVVGDASILINTMIDRSDNALFVEELYANESTVLLDVSPETETPPLVELVTDLRAEPVAQIAVGLLGIGFIAGISGRLSNVPVLSRDDRRSTNTDLEGGDGQTSLMHEQRQTEQEADDR